MPECPTLIRAPFWFIGLLFVVALGVGIYGYYTTPLPLGLSSLIETPGNVAAEPTPTVVPVASTARAAAGQPLVLGAATVTVQTVQRGQSLAASGGPPGSFTVVDIVVQNGGNDPLTPQLSDFRLVDSLGRQYAVDLDATRAADSAAHQRVIFDATVPPEGSLETLLAYETPADASSLALHVTLGYGEVSLTP